MDLLRVKALLAGGASLRQVSKSLGVPLATVHRAGSKTSARRPAQVRATA
jgi:hypothetical protein